MTIINRISPAVVATQSRLADGVGDAFAIGTKDAREAFAVALERMYREGSPKVSEDGPDGWEHTIYLARQLSSPIVARIAIGEGLPADEVNAIYQLLFG